MSHFQRSLSRYGFACAAVAAAFLLTWAIPPFRRQTPSLLLSASVVFAAWFGGLQAGLLGAGLAVLALDSLLPPLVEVFPGFGLLLRGGVFAVTVLLIVALKERNRRAEEGRRQSEERFGVMAETVPDILFTCRADGSCDYVNRRFYELTGSAPDSALDRRLSGAMHPDEAGACAERWDEAARQRTPFEAEARLRAGGDWRWFVVRARPLCDEKGRILRWVGACTDIDAQKRAHEALAEADRRKDEFLAMLGHELRNPLNPVRSAVELLRLRRAGDGEVERLSGVIARQIDHLVRLVDDLLDVSRISQGKIELRRRTVDLRASVARAVEQARPALQERQHHLEVDLREALWVRADPDRLDQVAANLLNNAARYTPAGGRIKVVAGLEQGQAVLRVADNGIGVRPEMLPRIFDVFQQADRVPGRVSEGLGLGLAVVRRLVEMHGGAVEAHSAGPGQGSEFVVRLPLSPAGPPEQGKAPGRPSSPEARPLRVLVVDDNVDGAESLAMLLRLGEGHEARVAHDGPAALAAAGEFRPDVVLLDIGLPGGMDGYEVARRLAATDEGKNVLLVALTGFGREEDRRHSREVGIEAHLVKPVDVDRLRELLRERQRGGNLVGADAHR
jgi:two-component system CheB/CheR fusion protein